jgi:hypothetical protein
VGASLKKEKEKTFLCSFMPCKFEWGRKKTGS